MLPVLEAYVVYIESPPPRFAACNQNMDQRMPVIEMGGDRFRRFVVAAADGDWRRRAVVAVECAEFRSKCSEIGEHVRRKDLFEAGELGADGVIEGTFEAGYRTPATVYGADFILSFPGTERKDLDRSPFA